ncbi:GyrI-like domain-containing protein [Paenibacillus sp. L3-i20]|uniref:GyrI-like domain-containing protein n=1 Tax=Paenibacillus sp. L3-i20 TaxID=2905833 RepID=UPI0020C153F1|nr:GyrI-like domain-containing protein [Paenibacillus sp. L3-i20]
MTEVTGTQLPRLQYGVFIDPPNYNPDTDTFTWIAGVEVTADAVPPEGMISYKLPQATYAVLGISRGEWWSCL